MTKNQPTLRKVVSNADLYSDPSPPQRHANLSRTFTTVLRPRMNPFTHTRSVREPARHSIAAPTDNLIDFDDNFGSPKQPQKSPTPPPVPPKVKIAPVLEIPAYIERKEEKAAKRDVPERYTKPFTDFMTANPTVFHAVDAVAKDLDKVRSSGLQILVSVALAQRTPTL